MKAPKRPRDPNQLTRMIVDLSTSGGDRRPESTKNEATTLITPCWSSSVRVTPRTTRNAVTALMQ